MARRAERDNPAPGDAPVVAAVRIPSVKTARLPLRIVATTVFRVVAFALLILLNMYGDWASWRWGIFACTAICALATGGYVASSKLALGDSARQRCMELINTESAAVIHSFDAVPVMA